MQSSKSRARIAASAAIAVASLVTVQNVYGALLAGWDFQTTTSGGTAISASPNTPTLLLANAGLSAGSAAIFANGTNGSSTWLSSASNPQITSFGGSSINVGAGMSSVTSGTSALAIANSSANGFALVFKFSTLGYQNLGLTYATQKTTTGFSSQQWDYSTDGVNYTSVASAITPAASYAIQTFNGITGLNNASTAYLRLTVTGASNASGNNRLDNFQLNATAIAAASYLWTGTGSGNTWTVGSPGNFATSFANDPTNDVSFAGTGETVSLSGSVQSATTTFNPTSGAYTLNGGTLALSGAASVTVSGTNNATINSLVTSTTGLTKAGTGTLTLTSSTITGATVVSGGTLVTSASNVTDLSVVAGATFTTTGTSLTDTISTSSTIAGTINGSGSFNVVGPNTDGLTAANRGKSLTVNSALTNTGGVSITSGTLISKSGSYIPTTGTVTVGTWGQLQLDGAADGETYGTTGQLYNINGQGDVTVTASNTFVGGTSGAIVANKSVTVNSDVVMQSNSTLATTNTGKTMTLNGKFIQGAFELQKFGSGDVVINNTPSTLVPTGNTFIGNGGLYVGSGAQLGSGTLTLGQSGANLLSTLVEFDNAAQTVTNLTSQWAATNSGTTASGSQTLILNGGALTVNSTADTTFGTPFNGVNGTITLTGTVNLRGPGSLVKTGPAKLTLDGSNLIYQGSTTVNAGTLDIKGTYAPQLGTTPASTLGVTGGTAAISGTASFFSVTSATDVPVTGTLNIVASAKTDVSTVQSITGAGVTNVTAATLNSANGIKQGTLALTGAVAKVLANGTNSGLTQLNTLTIDSSSKFDITDNDMIITGQSLPTVVAYAVAGRNGGAWDGTTGLTSSSAAASPAGLTTLGVTTASALGVSSFDGVTGLSGTEVLVKYTYYGDATLNGKVDTLDLVKFLSGYGATNDNGSTTEAWATGDFNFDGLVNTLDLSKFLQGYGATNDNGAPDLTPSLALALSADVHSAALAESAVAVVPEPTSLGLLAVGAMGLLRRRRVAK